MDFLDQTFFGNPVRTWALAVAAFTAVMVLLPTIRRLVIARARRVSAEARPPLVELVLLLITRTRPLWIFVAALYAGERVLDLPDRVERISTGVIIVVAWLQAAVWGVAMIEFLLRNRQAKLSAEGAQRQSGSISVLNASLPFIQCVIGFCLQLAT